MPSRATAGGRTAIRSSAAMPLNAWTIEPRSGNHSAMLCDSLEEVPGVVTLAGPPEGYCGEFQPSRFMINTPLTTGAYSPPCPEFKCPSLGDGITDPWHEVLVTAIASQYLDQGHHIFLAIARIDGFFEEARNEIRKVGIDARVLALRPDAL